MNPYDMDRAMSGNSKADAVNAITSPSAGMITHLKKERSTYEQQRRINQAKERREKRNLKRAKRAFRNSGMG